MDSERVVTEWHASWPAGAVAGELSGRWAILETTGRRSGKRRRNPVGNGLEVHTFWMVAERGRRAGYVRNIEANPRVRVKVGGRWRAGVAYPMPDDDPRERQRRLGQRLNAPFVRAMGTELLTVRVDLDPGADPRWVAEEAPRSSRAPATRPRPEADPRPTSRASSGE